MGTAAKKRWRKLSREQRDYVHQLLASNAVKLGHESCLIGSGTKEHDLLLAKVTAYTTALELLYEITGEST